MNPSENTVVARLLGGLQSHSVTRPVHKKGQIFHASNKTKPKNGYWLIGRTERLFRVFHAEDKHRHVGILKTNPNVMMRNRILRFSLLLVQN